MRGVSEKKKQAGISVMISSAKEKHTHTHTRTLTHTRTHTRAHSHTLTHSLTHSYTHPTHIRTHTQPPTRIHIHTNIHTNLREHAVQLVGFWVNQRNTMQIEEDGDSVLHRGVARHRQKVLAGTPLQHITNCEALHLLRVHIFSTLGSSVHNSERA
jgi:hypothetical protein